MGAVPVDNMPEAELDIGEPLVRELLRQQAPSLASLPLRLVANGWDNVIFRLGDALAVRLPRRQMAVPLVAHEQRWLASLAERLPLPIPVPVVAGVASATFPWPWSVCPWFAGDVAARTPPTDADQAALDLGRFLAALHQPAPPEAPANPYRGVGLSHRDELVRGRLAQLEPLWAGMGLDGARLMAVWEEALAQPPWSSPGRWLHGDLHPCNLVVHEGRLAAVIDFGDLCAGDPATDLAAGWMLLPASAHGRFLDAYGPPDEATWRRARGWALALGLAMLGASADDPLLAAVGRLAVSAAAGEG